MLTGIKSRRQFETVNTEMNGAKNRHKL